MHQNLQIISLCLYGVANVMPNWADQKVVDIPLMLPTLIACDRVPNAVNNEHVQAFKCCITRREVANQIHDFFRKLNSYVNLLRKFIML